MKIKITESVDARNARLNAEKCEAAPELLKALENLLHVARGYFPDSALHHPEGAFQKARAAVAKARA